jgi:hypothetical protein
MIPERDMSDAGKEKMEAEPMLSDNDSIYNGTCSWPYMKYPDSLKRVTRLTSTWTSMTRTTIWMLRITMGILIISMPML